MKNVSTAAQGTLRGGEITAVIACLSRCLKEKETLQALNKIFLLSLISKVNMNKTDSIVLRVSNKEDHKIT